MDVLILLIDIMWQTYLKLGRFYNIYNVFNKFLFYLIIFFVKSLFQKPYLNKKGRGLEINYTFQCVDVKHYVLVLEICDNNLCHKVLSSK